MILPNLAARISWYQEHLRPDDPAMGNGIADWTITSEYVDNLRLNGKPVWGITCSPKGLPDALALTPEDVAAKRAHIMVRTPASVNELTEIERTILHECGHVLVAPMQSTNTGAEENAMHSIDALFAKLTPEQGRVLARAMHDPTARSYRARDGENMDEKDGDKKPDGEKPKAQDGVARDVGAIMADIVKAVLGGLPTDELVEAQALAGAAAGEEEVLVEPEPPMMGMKPDQAYARVKAADERAKAAQKEAIEAILDANPHLTDPQKTIVRRQGTAALAREVAASYPRSSAPPEPQTPRMGLPGHPSTPAGGGAKLTVRARAMQASPEVMARVRRGTSDEDTAGLNIETPGHILVYSPTEHLREMRGALQRAEKGAVQ